MTALAAGLGLATAGLVGAPAATALVAPAPTATPINGIAFGSPTQITLAWNVDSTDDTTVVTISPSGGTGCSGVITASDTTPDCTVTGLTAGTSYTFRVKVFEGSDDTTATVAATPYTVPDKPAIVATTAGNLQAWIDWTAPATGGSAITGYTATATATGEVTRTCTTTTETQCQITNLTNGKTYSVQVTATNAGGTSQPSTAAPVLPSATSGLPGVPTAVSAIATSATAAEVSFTPAAAVPGFPASSPFYTATCTSSTGGTTETVSGSSSPITVSGLTTNATYTCTVTATNANGASTASRASNPVTPNSVTPPGAPTIGTATGGSRQATVSWTAPSPLPTSAITTYQVAYLKDSGTWSSPITTGSTSASYTLTSLDPGSYVFRVRAVNVGGAGAWSNQSSPAVTVSPGTLIAPTAVTATPGVGQVSLAWTAPTGGTLAPTSYQVRFSSNAGVSWSEVAATGTTTTSATVTGLTNGTAYVFGVRAINGDVVSGWSTNSAAVSPGKPNVPTAVAGTAGNAQVSVAWTAPAAATGVPAPTGYQVQYQASGSSTWSPGTPLAATGTSLTVTGLTNGTAYVFRVRSMNGPVEGDWSALSAAVTPVSPVVKAIEISGERGKGSNRNRIYVEGVTTGFAAGTKLVPYFKFPGPSSKYVAGKARPEVDEFGVVTWTRKTGKKIYVYFATESKDVRSDWIAIPARG